MGRIKYPRTTHEDKNRCDIKAGKNIGDANGTLSSLVKQLTEAELEAEIDSHLFRDLTRNRKNSYSSKTMKSAHGAFNNVKFATYPYFTISKGFLKFKLAEIMSSLWKFASGSLD